MLKKELGKEVGPVSLCLLAAGMDAENIMTDSVDSDRAGHCQYKEKCYPICKRLYTCVGVCLSPAPMLLQDDGDGVGAIMQSLSQGLYRFPGIRADILFISQRP